MDIGKILATISQVQDLDDYVDVDNKIEIEMAKIDILLRNQYEHKDQKKWSK